MTTDTFYGINASTEDGRLKSVSNTYLTARAGGGTASGGSTSNLTCGQDFNDPEYVCYESFCSFDTSSILVRRSNLTVDFLAK